MDAVTLTILGKIVLAILLVALAFLTVILGYKLYKNGAGFGRDHLVLKWMGFEGRAGSVGSVVMLAACLWALPINNAIPSYTESADGGKHVYSAGNDLVATPMTIRSHVSVASLTSDPKALENHVRMALAGHSDRDGVLELEGQPARYVPDSVSVTSVGDGKYLAMADIETARSRDRVYFAVKSHNSNEITFRPWQMPMAVPPNDDPNILPLPGGQRDSRPSTHESLPLPNKDEESEGMKPAPIPMPSDDAKSNAPKPSPLPLGR